VTTAVAARRLPATVIVILGVLGGIASLSLDSYLPALPALAAEFAVGRSEAQITLTACLIGIAVGQLVVGPWSDGVGRRLPLLLGASGFAAASIACAFAPELGSFAVMRFIQGFAAAIGLVVGRAVVRDATSGPLAVRSYSQLATAGAIAPIVAPLLGSAILLIAGWRGVFVALGVLGAVLTVLLALFLRESHPRELRRSASPSATFRSFGVVLRDRRFLGYLGVGGFSAVTLFAYISGSSFFFQSEFGASPAQFAVAFAINGVGIAGFSQLNARLAPRVGSGRMLRIALVIQSTAAAGFVVVALFAPRAPSSIAVLMIVLFGIIAPMGLVMPNFIARGMSRAGANAGAASAFIGAVTFLVGGIVSPLTGLGDPVGSVAGLIGVGVVGASVLVVALTRHDREGSAERTQPEGAGA
jgi:DHA1 family bicyclomycin/chloramphenicol resistance-like MFS transporter